ncbi:MAG: hypothetical protein ACTMIA_03885 [Vibrio sp.]
MLHSNDSMTSFLPSCVHARPLSADASTMMQRLALLSNQRQWILYTAECPRPQISELSSYQVDFHKVIHMKPSQRHDEVAIVLQAIRSGTASAVVASHRIPTQLHQLLITTGKQHHCEVFFVPHHPTALH